MSKMEESEFRSASDDPTPCHFGRRIFSSPDDDSTSKYCLYSEESAEAEGIVLTQAERTNHFSNSIRMYGTVIASPDKANKLNKNNFSNEQADLLADADFDSDSIIVLQQSTGASPAPLELNNVGIVADESAFFVNFTTPVDIDGAPDFRTLVLLIEDHQSSDSLIAGQEERNHENEIRGHAIWKSDPQDDEAEWKVLENEERGSIIDELSEDASEFDFAYSSVSAANSCEQRREPIPALSCEEEPESASVLVSSEHAPGFEFYVEIFSPGDGEDALETEYLEDEEVDVIEQLGENDSLVYIEGAFGNSPSDVEPITIGTLDSPPATYIDLDTEMGRQFAESYRRVLVGVGR